MKDKDWEDDDDDLNDLEGVIMTKQYIRYKARESKVQKRRGHTHDEFE